MFHWDVMSGVIGAAAQFSKPLNPGLVFHFGKSGAPGATVLPDATGKLKFIRVIEYEARSYQNESSGKSPLNSDLWCSINMQNPDFNRFVDSA